MRLAILHISLIDMKFLAPTFWGQIEANFPRRAKNAVGLPKVRVLFQNALRGMEKGEFLPCKTDPKQPV